MVCVFVVCQLTAATQTLQMTARQLERMSKNADKEEKAEKLKLKKDMQRNNMEGARIHAESAIRQKNQSINYLRLSARVDAVASRVQTAVSMKQVTASLQGVVRSLDQAMQSMNLVQMSSLMDKFEKQFNDLDVQSAYMENAMGASASLSMPEGQVERLMEEVAEEHGLEVNMRLGVNTVPTAAAAAQADEDDLSQRLAKLRES